MKKFLILFATLVASIVSCSKSENSPSPIDKSNPISGAWKQEASSKITSVYNFNDGSLRVVTSTDCSTSGDDCQGTSIDGGSYTTSGNTITITLGGKSTKYTYEIKDNKLTLTSDEKTLTLTRQ